MESVRIRLFIGYLGEYIRLKRSGFDRSATSVFGLVKYKGCYSILFLLKSTQRRVF